MAGPDPQPGPRRAVSVYEGARTGELEDPLLPRWFVLLGLAAIPAAIGVLIWAFVAFGPEEVPVAARRPPPVEGSTLTTAVGEYNVGDLDPLELSPPCALLEGIRAGGTAVDIDRIAGAVDELCELALPEAIARRLQSFARVGGVVRFAQFEATGVDSTLDTAGDVPVVLVTARLARDGTDPLWIGPLIVHDTTWLEEPVGTAEGALLAREAEAEICGRMFLPDDRSRACNDAAALLALDDPLGALAAEGFR